ncbi:MAG TPA: hypothetical protein VFU88_12895 [Ktedonobacterales bacterium]|nr:hypothetical protein [Ktedonobacterales bacterium]
MAEKIPPHPPRHIQQPPPDDSYEHDLHPDMPSGQDHFSSAPEPGRMGRTLADEKEAYDRFPQFTADELKRIPLMPVGSQLEQGATYIDLAEPVIQAFTAYDEMVAGPEHIYVPKKDTSYLLWNRLLGVTNPARLDQGNAMPPGR